MATRTTTVAVMVALAACHAKPPPQAAPPTERSAVEMRARAAGMTGVSREPTKIEPKPERRKVARIPEPPAFDRDRLIPDPAHVLRWPLAASSHPDLTPQFPIATALAEPGLDWIALCQRGAHLRHVGPKLRDQITYLRAWCAVGSHETDVAIAGFASLRRSVVAGLSQAVRADIVNALVHHGGVDDAIRLLSKYQIRDFEIFDLLTATYLDLGMPDDGMAINDLLLTRDDPSRANRCRRQARAVVMKPDPYRSSTYRGRLLFDAPADSDRTCTLLEHELACWLRPELDCARYFDDVGIDVGNALLIKALYLWPRYSADTRAWLDVADYAIGAGTIPRAYDVAVEALEQAIRSHDCDASGKLIARRAQAMLNAPDRPVPFDERLRVLATTAEDVCD